MSPNRIVALLTPVVFAPLAGAASAWLAKHVPGAKVSAGDLQGVFIAGALIALAPALQWLHGWQKYEARQDETERAVAVANVAASAAPAIVEALVSGDDSSDEADEPEDFADLDDLDFDVDGLGDLDDELLALDRGAEEA
jgi:hypothetical protein